jgi:amino acid transporter
MAFREKSIVAQLIAILTVYGWYGLRLRGEPLTSLTSLTATATLLEITVVMTLILIAAHVVFARYSQPERSDERDRVIALRGSRNGYATLAAGVWCVLFLAVLHAPDGVLFWSIMGAVAVAELVRLGSQLLYYRFAA